MSRMPFIPDYTQLHSPDQRYPSGYRLYLSPYDTTPTYRNVHNKFSVSYMLNLVLVDQEDRRYFKQQVWDLPPPRNL